MLLSEVFEEVMRKGPFMTKIKGSKMGKVRKELKDRRVFVGSIGIKEPFVEAIQKKPAIKLEVTQMLKCQKELVNSFNAIAAMMPYIQCMGDNNVKEGEEVEIYNNLMKLWKVAFIEQSKALYDMGKDLKVGGNKEQEKPEIQILTEEDHKKVKDKKEERKAKTLEERG